ncbi:helicase HerA domain-containing protein, partial [Cryptosporangium minutisporangium]
MFALVLFASASASPPADPPLPGPSQWLLDALTTASSWCAARPWLAAIAAALAAAAFLASLLRQRNLHHRMARHAQLLTIHPPPEVDPAGASAFWADLAEILQVAPRRRLREGRSHVGLEYRWAGREFTIALWVPATVPIGPVRAAVAGAWPGATCTVTDADPPLPLDAVEVGGALAPALPAWYPLSTDHHTDPLRMLIAAAAGLHHPESACVQILLRPATRRHIRRLQAGVQALRTGRASNELADPATWLRGALNLTAEVLGPARRTPPASRAMPVASSDPQRDRDGRAGVDKLAAGQWEVAVRYGVAHTNPRQVDPENLRARLITLAHGIASAFGAWTGRNRLRRIRVRRPGPVLAGRVLRRGFLLSAAELATLAALPQDLAVPGLDRARARSMPAPIAVPAGGRDAKVLGRAEVGGHSVALPVVDARQHVHILGSTGSGKSTLLLNMILEDIHARRGVVVIDPKGDLVADVLERIRLRDAKRLVLLDPDQPPGVTLNPLSGGDPDLLVDNVVSIFSKIFASHWGPRMDDILRVACLTLFRRPDPTLTHIPRLLQDRGFRRRYTKLLTDSEGLLSFWDWYENAPLPMQSQVIAPLLS